jgi:RPA family protein
MPEERKRNIAFKLRIGDILVGKPIMDRERFSFLELGDKRIVRVNVVGNIVDKYESEGDKKYSFLTLDDGSGQIRIKMFGEDADKHKDKSQGQTIIVIGTLRSFNNETYISPEIIREKEPKYLLVRKLEIEKQKEKNNKYVPKEKRIAAKDKILGMIKNSEENGGIGIDKIILNLNEISPEIINQEIQKFIEEGIVFEPRPGKVRWLG